MRKTLLSLAALLALATPSQAATPKAVIVGDASVPVGQPIWLDASNSVYDEKWPLEWVYKSGPRVPVRYFDEKGKSGLSAFIPKPTPGVYEFNLKARGVPDGKSEVDIDIDTIKVVYGGGDPTPVVVPPVNPPAPAVDPIPPPPVVTTIGSDKLRVLILWESSLAPSREQSVVLNSGKVAAYLDARTMADAGFRAWRIWDKDTVVSNESSGWQAAMAAAKAESTALPKIVVFSDTALVKAASLTNEQAALDFLQTYGGK